MKTFKLKGLLQNENWLSPAFVTVDDNGIIVSVSKECTEPEIEDLNAYALPGFQNAHSHAFQYAMAGLAEIHSTATTPDDFWSWRDAMYQLALSIEPEDLRSIGRMLYSEMLRHGYTNVAEFHYVHHDKNGQQYSNLSEMGEALVLAAQDVGIGITLVPIFYQKGGFGKDPVDGQKRFISKGIDEYVKLLEASQKSTSLYDNANIALGMHSMRGVEPEIIKELAKSGPQNIPFHIHISEQLKEIEDSIAYLGKRPVEWMLDNVELNDRFHLVHATHLTDSETDALARSKANVVLCPSTEGNLGDGIFPLKRFQDKGGAWSIGTDSHIGLNPLEELRLLDYGQRLVSHKRNTYYSQEIGDGGFYGINKALVSGRKAMNNFNSKYFELGEVFDAMLIDAESPLVSCSSLKNMCATILYGTDASMQFGTISKGKLIVKNGKHIDALDTLENFKKTIKDLKNR